MKIFHKKESPYGNREGSEVDCRERLVKSHSLIAE
jgi:hypothetical protein